MVELYRGKSTNPLFVSAAGMDKKDAADKISTMNGNYRIPDILKQLDRFTRDDSENLLAAKSTSIKQQ